MNKRNKWKCLIAIAMSTVMLIPAQMGYAAETSATKSGIEVRAENRGADANGFDIDENGVLIKYTGTAEDVVVPDHVTSIENAAFSGCSSLRSVIIPSSVTSIGDRAFSRCYDLTSITIPSGVTSIGDEAFFCCESLTGITIPSGVTSIGYETFWGCDSLTSITIPSGVTSIGELAFWGCSGLTSITIPSSLTSIDRGAFEVCSGLTSITIPSGVTSIGEDAFSGCSGLASINVEEGNERYDSRGNCNAIIEKESHTLMFGCKNTTIPSGVINIGDNAFQYCSGLTNITIPSSVTSIGDSAFQYCSGLTNITIPFGVTRIGEQIFQYCSGLTSITIPSGVTDIGAFAFQGCSGLTSITIPSGVTSIGHYAFCGCSGLSSMSIPSSVASIGQDAFTSCSGLAGINVEEGNKTYDSRENCNAIIEKESSTLLVGCKNTTIPSGVTSIGAAAFYDCSSLTEITIPPSVTSIGACAFWGCSGLTGITIPSSVTSIGGWAFRQCSEQLTIYGESGSNAETYAKTNNILFSPIEKRPQITVEKIISDKDVTISQTVYGYDGKAKTPEVTVKDGDRILTENTDYIIVYSDNVNAGTAKVSVTGKGNYKGTVTKAFTIMIKKDTVHKAGSFRHKVTGASSVSVAAVNSRKTKKVKIPGTVEIGGKTFKVTSIAKNAFKKNTDIVSVEVGDNVKDIGASAFEGCTKLKKVTVGKGVTKIGSGAFRKCRKLGTITIKSVNLKKVGKNALKGIKAVAKVKVPSKKLSRYKKLFKNKGQGKKVKVAK